MANIQSNTISGLFNANTIHFGIIMEEIFTIECPDCKDPILLAFDLTGTDSSSKILVYDQNNAVCKEIDLVSGKLNIVPITTFGMKVDGKIKMSIDNYSGIRVAIIAYTPVINN